MAEQARTTASTKVWVHASDTGAATTGKAGAMERKFASYMLRPEFYRTMWSLVRAGSTKIIPVREVSTFADDEVLDVPGKPRAVHIPGHTPGSAALFLESRRVLLTGDSLVTRNPLTGRIGPQIMPAGLNRDTAQALASLSALENLNAGIILPGHGDPWHGPVSQAVQLARAAGPS
jgi:glyoxylase-like metal-dependent hydrolase (beta-lactamase superfamily II)